MKDQKASQQRLMWLDIAKGIAILLVIVGHTFLVGSFERKLIFSFHMPLFFILAGYTFKPKANSVVAASSFKRLMVPFLLLFAIKTAYHWLRADQLDFDMVVGSFMCLLFASGDDVKPLGIDAIGIIWFLAALFFARITFNAATNALDARKVSLAKQGVVWLVVGLIGVFIGQPAAFAPFAFDAKFHIMLPMSYDLALLACFFMYLGYAFRKLQLERWLGNWAVLAIAVATWLVCIQFSTFAMSGRNYIAWPAALMGAISGTLIVCWFSWLMENRLPKLAMPLAWAGENSMLIYCVHAIDPFIFVHWDSLPLLEETSHAVAYGALARVAMDVTLANVLKRV